MKAELPAFEQAHYKLGPWLKSSSVLFAFAAARIERIANIG